MFVIFKLKQGGIHGCPSRMRVGSTSVRVPRKAKIVLCSSKIFLLCKNAFKWAIAQLSNQLGTIFRVRLKFALNHHWNLFFHDANFIFLIQIYGNFKVTLKMVPDWFDSRAMAHLNAFLQRKNIFEEQSIILAFLGTLTDVIPIPNITPMHKNKWHFRFFQPLPSGMNWDPRKWRSSETSRRPHQSWFRKIMSVDRWVLL